MHTWETGILFEAKSTADAERYCWKIESPGKTVEDCQTTTGYALPGGEAGINPGVVTVTAEALDDGGAALNSGTITLKVIARDIIKSPSSGRDYGRGETVRVRFEDVPTATDYCVTLTQGTISVPIACDDDGRVNVRLRRFDDGPVTIQAEVRRGREVIGRQSRRIDYTD